MWAEKNGFKPSDLQKIEIVNTANPEALIQNFVLEAENSYSERDLINVRYLFLEKLMDLF
jgi:hypothetical protein